MRPELIFHSEGFAAGSQLTALASHRADVLLRQMPGIARIRLLVMFAKMPNGAGIYAARGCVGGPDGETVAIEGRARSGRSHPAGVCPPGTAAGRPGGLGPTAGAMTADGV